MLLLAPRSVLRAGLEGGFRTGFDRMGSNNNKQGLRFDDPVAWLGCEEDERERGAHLCRHADGRLSLAHLVAFRRLRPV